MLRLSRRRLLQGAGAAGLVAARPALAASAPALLVYDSRIPESAAFAAASTNPARHDLAQGRIDPRRIAAIDRIEGLTRHSDYVALSLALRLNGMRGRDARRLSSAISTRDHLFRWSLGRAAQMG
ncbi:hypothetical protein [Novosphingobium sp. KACC 22771]|uniref:hypothetical protein n=1 Tax=Novosphingobium sp. KACC 22771 TaxID=3025670 RepID=UPI0023656E2B|nr:hypothetical protein [Novosphingobium sp. KACC 22771]WDF72122.1 hypothetical protein PQ467_15195 [Novosphingobium sp. KACC 22771]